MRILQLIENMDDRYGGPAKSVPYTCKYIQSQHIDAKIFSVKLYREEVNSVISANNLAWDQSNYKFFKKIRYSPELASKVSVDIRSHKDVILHSQNLWNYPTYLTYRLACKFQIPYISSVRGALYNWSLAQGKYRKKVAWYIFVQRMLREASCIHVTAESELQRVRDLGVKTPVAVIPNGLELDEFFYKPCKQDALDSLNLDKSFKYILFLSRIHEKKGIEFLIKSWINLFQKHRGWKVIVVGNAENARYLKTLKKQVARLNIKDSFIFLGPLNGQERLSAFAASELFVLPSHTENFGIVIAEAMLAKLPVITTTGTPWEELNSFDAGWWIDLDEDLLTKTINDAIQLKPSFLKLKGERGYKLINEKYLWEQQATKFIEMYNWVLGKSERPECIVL